MSFIRCKNSKPERRVRGSPNREKTINYRKIKEQALKKKELPDRFANRLECADEILESLMHSLNRKDALQFLDFKLLGAIIWLKIADPEGVKEF